MSRHDKADGRAEQSVEQIHVLLARHAEDVFDTLVLQAFHDEFDSFHRFTFRLRRALLFLSPLEAT